MNPQQIRTLEHKMPKAAKVAKAVKKADAQPAWRSLTANVSKQGLTLKHRNAAPSGFKCSPGHIADSRNFTGNPNGSVYLGYTV